MAQPFNINTPVGDIVAQFPRAGEVFKKYKIDFCCGGDRPLARALQEDNGNETEVMGALEREWDKFQSMQGQDMDWRTAPLSDLIDHIMDNHHRYLAEELPLLGQLTTMILRAHSAEHGEDLSKVHRFYHNLKAELEQHMITEEEVLFPLVKEYEKTGSRETLNRAIEVLEQLEKEHEGAGDVLKSLREITRDYVVPAGVCDTFCKTYERLVILEADMFQHIHLENNILHPRLRQVASN